MPRKTNSDRAIEEEMRRLQREKFMISIIESNASETTEPEEAPKKRTRKKQIEVQEGDSENE